MSQLLRARDFDHNQVWLTDLYLLIALYFYPTSLSQRRWPKFLHDAPVTWTSHSHDSHILSEVTDSSLRHC